MEIQIKLKPETTELLELNNDTVFETYFEDGIIHIRTLTDEELEDFIDDDDNDNEEFDD